MVTAPGCVFFLFFIPPRERVGSARPLTQWVHRLVWFLLRNRRTEPPVERARPTTRDHVENNGVLKRYGSSVVYTRPHTGLETFAAGNDK